MADEKIQDKKVKDAEDFHLDWKWHVRTLIIIYISLFIMLQVYIVVMRGIAGKHTEKGKELVEQAEKVAQVSDIITKNNDKSEEIMGTVIEIVSRLEKVSNNPDTVELKEDEVDTFIKRINATVPEIDNIYKTWKFKPHVDKSFKSTRELGRYFAKRLENYKENLKNRKKKEMLNRALQVGREYQEKVDALESLWSSEKAVDEAIREFNTAVNDDRKFLEGHYYLGVAYEKQGLVDEAYDEFIKVIELKKGSDKAAELFSRFEKEYNAAKTDARINYYYGKALVRMKRQNEGVEFLKKAIDLEPNGLWALYAKDVLDEIK